MTTHGQGRTQLVTTHNSDPQRARYIRVPSFNLRPTGRSTTVRETSKSSVRMILCALEYSPGRRERENSGLVPSRPPSVVCRASWVAVLVRDIRMFRSRVTGSLLLNILGCSDRSHPARLRSQGLPGCGQWTLADPRVRAVRCQSPIARRPPLCQCQCQCAAAQYVAIRWCTHDVLSCSAARAAMVTASTMGAGHKFA